MTKGNSAKPRRPYSKPLIAVEDFTMNQFIASCTIKTRHNANWEAELMAYSPFLYDYMKATNQFIDDLGCINHADKDMDDGMDTLCYHTSTSPLFTS